jgi:hypothetical protein
MSTLKNFLTPLLLASTMTVCSSGMAQTPENPNAAETKNGSILTFLEKFGGGDATNYKIGWADLDGDGKQEAIVLMTGEDWCGSGGCTLAVLKHNADSWTVVSKVPTCRPPVLVLDEKTNGWRELAVSAQGGGDPTRRALVLRFQKGRYVKHSEIATKGGRVIIP